MNVLVEDHEEKVDVDVYTGRGVGDWRSEGTKEAARVVAFKFQERPNNTYTHKYKSYRDKSNVISI